jgi:RimJ/RimL family protein N-acetyltransferase
MLKGKLIQLRKAIRPDMDKYLELLNDPEIARLIIGTVIPVSPEYTGSLIDGFHGINYSQIFFTIETLGERRVIGFCLLKNLHPIHRFAELEQFFIGEKKFRNNGYGKDALKTLLKYCFTELNLNRIWLITYAYNQEAIRFYEKSGFLKEGILRQIQYTWGAYQDGVILAILKNNWKYKFNQQKHLIPKGQTRFLLP